MHDLHVKLEDCMGKQLQKVCIMALQTLFLEIQETTNQLSMFDVSTNFFMLIGSKCISNWTKQASTSLRNDAIKLQMVI